ncbi:hypothetical protein RHO14_04310 [Orbus wheelerorum]|uniref:hypothetical protein n=1 Tax=Orbus wheelerorum TaxID=3074111 RepID=UPI00370DD9F5
MLKTIKTDDERKSIGFFYQDYVALKYLMSLNEGETLGIEVYDDIHHEGIEGNKTLIQVKHSINEATNLTNKDVDLWKTLFNWSNMSDSIDDKDLSFHFYTNKPLTKEKGVLELITAKSKNIEAIKKEIGLIEAQHENKDSELYKYIHHINSLDTKKLKKIIDNIEFIHDNEKLIQEIKNSLKNMAVPNNKIDDAFHSILGSFTNYKYNEIKQTNKVEISYELFRNKLGFNRTIQLSRNCGINFDKFHQFDLAYPNDIENNISYNQLKDLKFGIRDITGYCNQMAKTEAFLQQMMDEGELTGDEYQRIQDIGVGEWSTHHSVTYLGNDFSTVDNEHLELALKLYKQLIIECNINIDNTPLPKPMITGTLIKLSDIPRIGWLQNWEDKYK